MQKVLWEGLASASDDKLLKIKWEIIERVSKNAAESGDEYRFVAMALYKSEKDGPKNFFAASGGHHFYFLFSNTVRMRQFALQTPMMKSVEG